MDLQHLLDLEEIKQLRYGFSWCLETSAPDELADLFTADGVVDVGRWGRMVGQDAIRRGYRRAYQDAEPWTSMHFVTNPRIAIEADTARGSWYLLNAVAGSEQPVRLVGVYEDEYRRVDGSWRIASLTLHLK